MKKGLSVWPALSTVAYGVFSALFYAFGVHADDDIQFDSNFLRISHPENVDLSAYMNNAMPAGRYRADIYLNDKLVMIFASAEKMPALSAFCYRRRPSQDCS